MLRKIERVWVLFLVCATAVSLLGAGLGSRLVSALGLFALLLLVVAYVMFRLAYYKALLDVQALSLVQASGKVTKEEFLAKVSELSALGRLIYRKGGSL